MPGKPGDGRIMPAWALIQPTVLMTHLVAARLQLHPLPGDDRVSRPNNAEESGKCS